MKLPGYRPAEGFPSSTNTISATRVPATPRSACSAEANGRRCGAGPCGRRGGEHDQGPDRADLRHVAGKGADPGTDDDGREEPARMENASSAPIRSAAPR